MKAGTVWPTTAAASGGTVVHLDRSLTKAAYVSPHVRHHLERQRRKPESHSGIAASCESQSHYGHIRSSDSDEKRKAQSKVVEMIMPGIRKKAGR